MKRPAKKLVLTIIVIGVIAAVIGVLCHFACSASDSDWLSHPIEQSKRLEVSIARQPKKIAQMAAEDIIVLMMSNWFVKSSIICMTSVILLKVFKKFLKKKD